MWPRKSWSSAHPTLCTILPLPVMLATPQPRRCCLLPARACPRPLAHALAPAPWPMSAIAALALPFSVFQHRNSAVTACNKFNVVKIIRTPVFCTTGDEAMRANASTARSSGPNLTSVRAIRERADGASLRGLAEGWGAGVGPRSWERMQRALAQASKQSAQW